MKETKYQNGLKRAIAYVIDMMLLIPVYLVMSPFVGDSNNADNLTTIIVAILFLSYMILAEGFFGQSLGKRLLGIKVAMENGGKCTLKAAIVRNLLRIIDAIPSIYIVGILVITFTKKRQRIGDLAAKTVVVRI